MLKGARDSLLFQCRSVTCLPLPLAELLALPLHGAQFGLHSELRDPFHRDALQKHGTLEEEGGGGVILKTSIYNHCLLAAL